jgi:hypothetical protein
MAAAAASRACSPVLWPRMMSRDHPAIFAAALLNSQPMGFSAMSRMWRSR